MGNQACCMMAEGNLCRTLTFLEHSLTPPWELKQTGTRKKHLKAEPLQYCLAYIASHPRKRVPGMNEAFRGCMHMRKPFVSKSYGEKKQTHRCFHSQESNNPLPHPQTIICMTQLCISSCYDRDAPWCHMVMLLFPQERI